jgi:integrase
MADRFTDRNIAALRPTEKVKDIREGGGFGIRIFPNGDKIWFYRYMAEGKRRFLTLGHYPAVSLATARIKCQNALSLMESGIDPLTLKEKLSEEDRKTMTVADLCREYMVKHAKVFKKSWHLDEWVLKHEIVPAWGRRKAEDIRKRDVILLLENIMERDAPGMSNQTLKITRKMFNFAVERDILNISPCNGVKALAPEKLRERHLNATEVKTLWKALEAAAISNEIQRALKLILVTAQRPGEVIGMHARELDGRWWTIPGNRAKNGKSHRVYLTETALTLIGDTGGKGFIFPSPHRMIDRPIAAHALPVAVRRNLAWQMTDGCGKPLLDTDGNQVTENRLHIAQFTPHDLRRTAATFMAQAGASDEVIDAVLNHCKQGIIRVYNCYRYDKEKQQALVRWEQTLQGIINQP